MLPQTPPIPGGAEIQNHAVAAHGDERPGDAPHSACRQWQVRTRRSSISERRDPCQDHAHDERRATSNSILGRTHEGVAEEADEPVGTHDQADGGDSESCGCVAGREHRVEGSVSRQ